MAVSEGKGTEARPEAPTSTAATHSDLSMISHLQHVALTAQVQLCNLCFRSGELALSESYYLLTTLPLSLTSSYHCRL